LQTIDWENIGKICDELVERWNQEYPDDPIAA